MRRLSLLLAVLIALASGSYANTADLEPSKEQDIRKLIELMGGAGLGEQIMDTMIAQLKPASPAVAEEFWVEFRGSVNFDELLDLIVPIYDRHLSHEDIRGLIEFYSSPLGQRVLRKLPVIMQESMAVGNEWGQQLGREVVQRMNAPDNGDNGQQ